MRKLPHCAYLFQESVYTDQPTHALPSFMMLIHLALVNQANLVIPCEE